MYNGSFLEFIAEAQYSNHIYQYSESGTITHDVRAHEPHEGVVYYINRHGFPGREFIKNADILAIGDSVTAGIGVGSNNTWPWMVESMTGMSVNQLGISGASIQVLLSAFLEFIEKFGKPKILLALLPEVSRVWVYHNEYPFRHRYSVDIESGIFMSHEKSRGFKTDIRGASLDIDTCIQSSYNALMDISRICSLLDIRFIFFPYLIGESHVYRGARMKNFLNPEKFMEEDGYDDYMAYIKYLLDAKSCTRHENFDVAFWHCGVDNPPHPGMHEHLHFAELFARELSR